MPHLGIGFAALTCEKKIVKAEKHEWSGKKTCTRRTMF
jgi:hypothetical protein